MWSDRLAALGYEVADFNNDGDPHSVELLIVSDHFWQLTAGRTAGLEGKLRAVETVVGWIIHGPVEGSKGILPVDRNSGASNVSHRKNCG
ncbi:hypothetical protein MTO96_033581 [Rhipicephalus appendiculatus]